ncbi:hypothetical protein [Paenibacillus sp. 481]|uniref:hypothetical protein n=1 Tax=Paenibacillus sp. 481 TaxID=2835869 RepID=UPI001E2A2531|nr:hypothetical protein [Paenibacillus sp. 481]UHA73082.1 hypothetical protein KIK04_21190 [Paenibacillus sp. 481]
MKFKKLLAILMLAASMTVMDPSAFAAKGIADTRQNAMDIPFGQQMSLVIEGAGDQDWYKWTNNTGTMKYSYNFLTPMGLDCRYRFGMIVDYNNGKEFDLLIAKDLEDSGGSRSSIQQINKVIIPPGATVYYVVESKNGMNGQYKLYHSFLNM